MTTTPLDVAKKTSEAIAPPPAPNVESAGLAETPAVTERADADLAEQWKGHARTWEDRAKANAAEAEASKAESAALAASVTELESTIKAMEGLAETALRYGIALDHGMDRKTADDILTGTDEETLKTQAEAFSGAVTAAVEKATTRAESATQLHGDPNQGQPGKPKKDYAAIAAHLRQKY